ncbi:MAG: hypothetical protein J6X43_00355 [Bacteroidales bacterium]|nr:hypothetical protein [Bacteroidales bacterium]
MKKIFLCIGLAISGLLVQAQTANPKIQFNGMARGDMSHNWLSSDDTTNVDQSLGGAALIDLHLDIRPSDAVRISSTLRVKNAIGGFWGQGASLELREISIKGVAAKRIKYRFGDIDSKMTPYTLWNYYGECDNNEAEVFRFIREIRHQENFNYGHYWRNQGGDLSWRLGFDKGIESIDFNTFAMRNRSLDDGKTPDRLQAGGTMKFHVTNSSQIGFNYINLFDLPKTVSKTYYEKYTNGVGTTDFGFFIGRIHAFGELGFSTINYVDTADTKTVNTKGNFFEVGLEYGLVGAHPYLLYGLPQLSARVSFRRVNQNFFSAGAQSKRINYTSDVNVLPVVGTNSYNRTIALLDLLTDDAIYNQAISYGLMDYEMIFNNVTPYGKATPNRQGFDVALTYNAVDSTFDTDVEIQLLQDVAGQGSEKKKNYLLAQWKGNVYFDKIFGWNKSVNVTAGYQFASASRDEDRVYKMSKELVKPVDLHSHTIDLGASVEVLNRVDVLVGTKMLFYKGTDYKAILNGFNETVKYQCETYDGSQMLTAAGLRYRFNDNISLTLQYDRFNLKDKNDDGNSYKINQAFLLFNILF